MNTNTDRITTGVYHYTDGRVVRVVSTPSGPHANSRVLVAELMDPSTGTFGRASSMNMAVLRRDVRKGLAALAA